MIDTALRLIEIQLEGLPGARGVLSYPLEAGLNECKPKSAFRPEILVQVIETLLYPSAGASQSLGPAAIKRAVLRFEARGVTYQLHRDYAAKSLQLSQLETGSQDRFRELSRDPRFIVAVIARAARIPSRKLFRSFLVARPGAPLALDEPEISFATVITKNEEGTEEAKTRLAALKEERSRLERVREVEFHLDGLQARVFKVDDELRRLEEPAARLAQLETELKPYVIFDAPTLITPGILERLKAFPKLHEKKAADLSAIDERAQEWTADLGRLVDIPVWKDPAVVGCAAGTVVTFVAATFVEGWAWILFLLSIVGIAGTVRGWVQFSKKDERRRQLRSQLRGVDSQRAGIGKRFDIESATLRKFFETVRMTDVAEIEEAMMKHRALRDERQKAEEECARIRAEVPEESMRKERAQLVEEIGECERELKETPPVSVDPNALEIQIRELEGRLGDTSEATAVAPHSLPTDDPNRLAVLAAEMLGKPLADLLRIAEPGFAANLGAITERKLLGVEFRGGQITGFREAGGGVRNWSDLSRDDQPAIRFAIQFTFWQLAVASDPGLFVLDLATVPVSGRFTQLSASAARHLSKRAQILLLMP